MIIIKILIVCVFREHTNQNTFLTILKSKIFYTGLLVEMSLEAFILKIPFNNPNMYLCRKTVTVSLFPITVQPEHSVLPTSTQLFQHTGSEMGDKIKVQLWHGNRHF